MIQQAMAQGNVEVTQGESRTIDLRGSGLREEIMGIMREHGIDADPGSGQQIDASSMPGMQQQILEALEQHGLDLGAIGGGDIQIEQSGASGFDVSSGDSGDGGDSASGDSGGGGGSD